MNRIFAFEFKISRWISDTEQESVETMDVVIIDVPDELTESLDIFRFAKKNFLDNQEKKTQIDVTSIRELSTAEAIKRTKNWKTPLDLTDFGLSRQPKESGWYWFTPTKSDEESTEYFRENDATCVYVTVENQVATFQYKDGFHTCNELTGYFETANKQ